MESKRPPRSRRVETTEIMLTGGWGETGKRKASMGGLEASCGGERGKKKHKKVTPKEVRASSKDLKVAPV